jgi:hypothetical protein
LYGVEVGLIVFGQERDDAFLGLRVVRLPLPDLFHLDVALNDGHLGEERRAQLSGDQQRQKRPEVDGEHEERHDADEAEVELALQGFLDEVDAALVLVVALVSHNGNDER